MRRIVWVALVLALIAARLRAQDDAFPLGRDDPHHTPQRAGYPPEVSCLARPTQTPAYCGYYVGGGAPGPRGAPPTPAQGTWGRDYAGWHCLSPRVVLGWADLRQGGTGQYHTDGPHVPNVFALKLPHKEEAPEH
jgi:hypothetical protein